MHGGLRSRVSRHLQETVQGEAMVAFTGNQECADRVSLTVLHPNNFVHCHYVEGLFLPWDVADPCI